MLNHENIVGGYDVGEECGIAYFAMEYVDGPSVQKIIDKSSRIHENIAMNITTVVFVGPASSWELDVFGNGYIIYFGLD